MAGPVLSSKDIFLINHRSGRVQFSVGRTRACEWPDLQLRECAQDNDNVEPALGGCVRTASRRMTDLGPLRVRVSNLFNSLQTSSPRRGSRCSCYVQRSTVHNSRTGQPNVSGTRQRVPADLPPHIFVIKCNFLFYIFTIQKVSRSGLLL